MMDFKTLKQLMLEADRKGTLIIDRHNPDKVSTIFTEFRTVVSHQVAENLVQFIEDEDYSVREYQNIGYPFSPLYYTITPNPDSSFVVPSSGVTGNVPTEAFDTLVIVSGGTVGIHMYGNSSSDIQSKIANGKLTNERILKLLQTKGLIKKNTEEITSVLQNGGFTTG
jgi:hypothetical protein